MRKSAALAIIGAATLMLTTLTSVGLSDVAPTLAHARSVVMLEQMAGVMYVALVVTRLVGLTIRRER